MLGARGRRIVDGDVFRRLLVARDFMNSSFDEPIDLERIASVAGISPFHCLRLFSRAFGETPHAYLQRLRLEAARERLARGAGVTEACFDVGYASLGSFSSLFSRHYGVSPSEWRRSARRLVSVPESYALLYIPCCFSWGVGESQFPRSRGVAHAAQ